MNRLAAIPWVTRATALLALISIFQPVPTFADDPSSGSATTPVKASVVTLDPSDPASCKKFQDFLSSNQVDIQTVQVRQALEDSICRPTKTGTLVSIIVLKNPPSAASSSDAGSSDSTDSKDTSNNVIEVNAGAEATHGNENFLHLNADFKFSHLWNQKNLIRLSGEGEYESDSDVRRALVTADYMYDLTSNLAVFGVVSLKHDEGRDLNIGTEEYAGLMYNMFPFAVSQDYYLMASAGVGHRYDAFSDGYIRNEAIASYRASFMTHLSKQFELMTAIWFQHVIVNPSDYRVLFQADFQYGQDVGFHANLNFEDEYWSDPRPGTEDNDVRVTMGFGYTWQ